MHLCYDTYIPKKKTGEPYKRDKCDKSYSDRKTFRYHLQSAHTSEKRYQCNQCDFSTKTSQSLNGHVQRVHAKELKQSGDQDNLDTQETVEVNDVDLTENDSPTFDNFVVDNHLKTVKRPNSSLASQEKKARIRPSAPVVDVNPDNKSVTIVMNDKGEINYDEKTLQSIIDSNQQSATVTFVRVSGNANDDDDKLQKKFNKLIDAIDVLVHKDSILNGNCETIVERLSAEQEVELLENGFVRTVGCDTCGKTFFQDQHLADHNKFCWPKFLCDNCEKTFVESTHLKEHLVQHHSPEEMASMIAFNKVINIKYGLGPYTRSGKKCDRCLPCLRQKCMVCQPCQRSEMHKGCIKQYAKILRKKRLRKFRKINLQT